MRSLIVVVLVSACGSPPSPPPVIQAPVAPHAALHDAAHADAAPELRGTYGRTSLHDAAQGGKLDEVRRLIDGGADLEAVEDVYRFTPLLLALEYSEPEAALLLLEKGASTAGPIGVHGLALAARGGSAEVIDALLARGVAVKGTFALHAAAKHGHARAIERLLKAGAPVDEVEPNDLWTPLSIACMENRFEVAKVLIAAGASVMVKDDDGNMPLHWALFGARPNEIHEYEELGKPHDTYWVPQRDAPLVELLLKRGAPIDALDGDGDTALHRAVLYEAANAVKVLLGHGADRRIKNRDGKTPIDIARARGFGQIERLLR